MIFRQSPSLVRVDSRNPALPWSYEVIGAIVAGSWRLCCAGILLSLLLAGCSRPEPLPPELTQAGVQAHFRIPKGRNADLAKTMDKLHGRGDQSVLPAPSPSHQPKTSAFSLTDAIVFAREHNPRLRSARAAIERARGQEQAAFAPYLPLITFGTDYGATSYNLGPGGGGPTGFILPSNIPGTHSYYQETLQLAWTIYDFGRRAGRYQEAVARKKITKLQLVRADQTVQFNVTLAYLNILLARASLLVQEEAIRQAQSTLKDAWALWKGGGGDP